jgi:hypothetical protein
MLLFREYCTPLANTSFPRVGCASGQEQELQITAIFEWENVYVISVQFVQRRVRNRSEDLEWGFSSCMSSAIVRDLDEGYHIPYSSISLTMGRINDHYRIGKLWQFPNCFHLKKSYSRNGEKWSRINSSSSEIEGERERERGNANKWNELRGKCKAFQTRRSLAHRLFAKDAHSILVGGCRHIMWDHNTR